MAAVLPSPSLPDSRLETKSHTTGTLPKPQDFLPSTDQLRVAPARYPDLSSEVTTLSDKLIRAINHQTELDDTLAETRHELNEAHRRIRQLEAVTAAHESSIATGEFVPRSEVERQKLGLMENLVHEQKERGVMEKDKRGMEQELESLTTALFEEANQMVAAARKERQAADRRSDQLRAQLNDTELLLANHQEQLAQLKAVMHQMAIDREGSDVNTASSTAPSTPALHTFEALSKTADATSSLISSTELETVAVAPAPAPPTTFAQLLHPVLRTDLQAYDDFHALLSLSRKSLPHSRVPSGSFGSLTVTNLSNLAAKEHHQTPNRFPSNGSASSLATSATYSSSPVTLSSTNSSVSSRDVPCAAALKETRFYKRVMTEDIEPTLRLDTAPGLSWLARRAVVNSMSEGSLVVEPMPASVKLNVLACSLCGETRKGEKHMRTHRFRTSENDNAQRYPLCNFCLTRVRASCDFLGFLRMLKDGHWRAQDDEAELQAWQECVKLRERMFWARIGGGVVPNSLHARESPWLSIEQTPEQSPESSTGAPQSSDFGCNESPTSRAIEQVLDCRGKSDEPSDTVIFVNEDQANSAKGCNQNKGKRSCPQLQGLATEKYRESVAAEKHRTDLSNSREEAPHGLGIVETPKLRTGHAAKAFITMPGAFE